VLNKDGRPSTDPLEARERGGFLTSLGGSPENSSYKGYGLAVMVNILGACLPGASLITDPMRTQQGQGNGVGHCFIAIDPDLFREREEFTADVTRLCDDLRATTPVDPSQPVMVAGDPQ
jgi:LDH2 family malate/lactate/ureidoglycolate dehydrogenase